MKKITNKIKKKIRRRLQKLQKTQKKSSNKSKSKLFLDACKYNHLDEAWDIYEQNKENSKFNINFEDIDEKTAIMYACENIINEEKMFIENKVIHKLKDDDDEDDFSAFYNAMEYTSSKKSITNTRKLFSDLVLSLLKDKIKLSTKRNNVLWILCNIYNKDIDEEQKINNIIRIVAEKIDYDDNIIYESEEEKEKTSLSMICQIDIELFNIIIHKIYNINYLQKSLDDNDNDCKNQIEKQIYTINSVNTNRALRNNKNINTDVMQKIKSFMTQ